MKSACEHSVVTSHPGSLIADDGVPATSHIIADSAFVAAAAPARTRIPARVRPGTRRQAERAQQFLSDLGNRIGLAADPEALLWEVVSATGAHLGALRCTYGNIGPDRQIDSVHSDYRPETLDLIGVFPPPRFSPDTAAALAAGQPLVHDAAPGRPNASVVVPVLKDGRWVSVLIVECPGPRTWTTAEIVLVQTVAQSTWVAVENARLFQEAQEELRSHYAREQEELRSRHAREQEELRTRYAREHNIAHTLQRSLMHALPARVIHGMEVAIRCLAASSEADVGGDFCDAFVLDGGKVALLTGDITGKGLKAAARIAEMKYALRAFLREDPRPASALARLNEFLCTCHRLDSHTESLLLCLSLAVAHPLSGEIIFATAGAEPPLVLRADGRADEIRLRCLPLGVTAEVPYISASLVLGRGDLVLMVTDGITEARRGKDFLGYEGMVDLVMAARNLESLDGIAEAVMNGACAFSGGRPHDDSGLLLARLH